MNQMIAVERVDHIGIRVRDLDRALNFYPAPGIRAAAPGRRRRGRDHSQ